MIEISVANEKDAAILGLLGTITYVESHGHFIDDKNELSEDFNIISWLLEKEGYKPFYQFSMGIK